jgi:hypothetical protein
MPDLPTHPVEALATFELRDLRSDLHRALQQTALDDPMREILQKRLLAVIAEQDERARARRAGA